MREYNGALPSPPDERDWHIDRCLDMPSGTASFPKSFKVSWLPKHKDQGYVNSCVSHVLALIFECLYYKKYGRVVQMSTGFNYGCRWETTYKGEGLYMRDAIKTICKYGDVLASTWDNNLEVPEAIRVFEEAYPEIAKFAKKLIKGYVRLRTEEEAKAHLMKYDLPLFANTQMRYINPLSKSTAYHAMAIVGWTRNDVFKCQNSWGILDCPNPEIDDFYKKFEEVWGVIPMEEIKFTDVSETDWAYDDIELCKDLGIVMGYEDNTLKLDNNITRREQIVMIARAIRAVKEMIAETAT